MAKIVGLDEQKKALAEIRSLIRKVDQINVFLENMNKAADDFILSYTVIEEPEKVTPTPEEQSDEFEDTNDEFGEFTDADELIDEEDGREEEYSSLTNPTDVPKAKVKQYKAPFITNDSSFIKECVLKSKEAHVQKIYDSASEYNISLDDEDLAIIERY